MEQGRLRVGRFREEGGRKEAIQGAPLIIITADWQRRPVRTDSARQPNQKPHLLLVSLNNEPLIWINGPRTRLTLIMASLITRAEEEGMKMKRRGGRGERRRLSECSTCLLTLPCMWCERIFFSGIIHCCRRHSWNMYLETRWIYRAEGV